MNSKPVLAVSIGCPAGIGPEVAVAAAARARGAIPLLVGDPEVVRRACETLRSKSALAIVGSRRALARLSPKTLAVWSASTPVGGPVTFGSPDARAGRAQLSWIDQATDLVTGGVADALVTGPVSKHAIATSGAPRSKNFLGHTEHLGRRLGEKQVVMAFWAREMTTALVTTHVSLADVPRAIRPRGVAASAYLLAGLMTSLGVRAPRIAIAALNPHAGEGGLLGREEIDVIKPGIEQARRRLSAAGSRAELTGPIGAETAFRQAVAGRFHGVVAMYHDQATIPMKLLSFGDAVNVTLGLPIVRTSVDHGTGYDIAGTGKADAAGMLQAMGLAARLASRASARQSAR